MGSGGRGGWSASLRCLALPGRIASSAADEHAPVRACRGCRGGRGVSGVEATAVVTDDQHGAAPVAFEAQLGSFRLGVPRDVRERLLRDAVDDELLLLGERGAAVSRCRRMRICACSATRSARARGRSGARGPRVPPVAAGARSCGPPRCRGGRSRAARRAVRAARRGSTAGQALDLQHHTRERLADLVVQFASDPLSLSLLDHQRAARAVASLGLQAIEHVVERLRQRGHVRLTVDARTRARRQRIVHGASSRRARRAAETPAGGGAG